nr:hypothetical protein GTC16762_33960 [Pigmentibacter ruber]
MANDFKVGDVVQLKSGSVNMTVTSIEKDRIWCKWFNSARDFPEGGISFGSSASTSYSRFASHQIGEEEFPAEALEKVRKS